MKNSLVYPLLSALVLLCFGTSHARADFVSPKVPAHASPAKAVTPAPGLALTWVVTNTRDDGPGSLRHAISNAAPGSTIGFDISQPHFPSFSFPAIIELKSTLVIDKDLNILGPGPHKVIIARRFGKRVPSFRIFDVNAGTVTIAGLSLVNGRALNPDGQADNLGGAIFNLGSLTVSNCIIAHNEARTEAGGVGYGGGIFTVGALTVVDSTITDNEVSGAGGGISTFHCPDFLLDRSTVSDNFAAVQGGGVNFQGTIGHLRNSTISGNETSDDGAASGLLHIVFPAEVSGLNISACTIVRNKGGTNAVVMAALSGSFGIVTRMIGTLVARNDAQNFALLGATLQSLGHNLDSDGTSGFSNGVNGDIVGTLASPINPRIGPLSYHGGPTLTHALLHGSPAVDAGACSDADGAPLVTDQRGVSRPQSAACDIGAYENQAPTIACPEPGTIDCRDKVRVTVSDADGDALTLVWNVDGTDVQTNSISDGHRSREVKLKTELAPGPHTIAVRVTDGKAPVVNCSTTLTVADINPPKITKLKASPHTLWPPNHKLVPVKLKVHAEDCGPTECQIVSVTSNQPVGDEPDWEITGNLTLKLRTERSENRARIYTVTVDCSDEAGHTSQETVTVRVEHDRRDRDDDDDDDD